MIVVECEKNYRKLVYNILTINGGLKKVSNIVDYGIFKVSFDFANHANGSVINLGDANRTENGIKIKFFQ